MEDGRGLVMCRDGRGITPEAYRLDHLHGTKARMPKRFPRHVWNTMDEETRRKVAQMDADTPGLFAYNIDPEFLAIPGFYTPVPPGTGRPSAAVPPHLRLAAGHGTPGGAPAAAGTPGGPPPADDDEPKVATDVLARRIALRVIKIRKLRAA